VALISEVIGAMPFYHLIANFEYRFSFRSVLSIVRCCVGADEFSQGAGTKTIQLKMTWW